MIDWLTLSTDNLALAQRCYAAIKAGEISPAIPALEAFLSKRFTYYTVSLPGKFWAQVDDMAVIDAIADREWFHMNLSRADFAIDIPGEHVTEARQQCSGQITWIESPSGCTVYSGSRESDRFLRVYDKASEIQARTGFRPDVELTRVELETKGRTAHRYMATWRNEGGAAIAADITDRYNLQFVNGHGDRITVPRPDTNDPMAFVNKFHSVLLRAWQSSPTKFLETIGAPSERYHDNAGTTRPT